MWTAFNSCLITQHTYHKRWVRLTFSFTLMQLQPFVPTSTPAASLIVALLHSLVHCCTKHSIVIPLKTFLKAITKIPYCHTKRHQLTQPVHLATTVLLLVFPNQTIPYLVTTIISTKHFYHFSADEPQTASNKQDQILKP